MKNVAIRPKVAGIVAAAALAALFAPSGARAGADEVVARVGITDVTSEEIRSYLESLEAREREAVTRDPPLLAQVVRSYLARQAVLQELKAKKWDQDPAVKAKLEALRERALAEMYLQAVSRPPDDYPTEAEIRSAYEGNPAAFAAPREYRLAQVFVAGPTEAQEGASAKVHARLEAVNRKLRQKGADFAAIAKAESDEKATAARGGEIGWLTEEQMVPGIRAAVLSLPKEAVSEPIRLADGWHIVKVLEEKPAGTRPLPEVRDAIKEALRAERAKAARQAYLAQLLERNPPAINELALGRVVGKGK